MIMIIESVVNMMFVGIYRFADAHNLDNLKEISLNYIQDNFFLVSQEEEWHEISKDMLCMFTTSEYLRVDSEYQVFLATMNWINHDIANR